MIVKTDPEYNLGPIMVIPLTKGFIALVSPEDYFQIAEFNWCSKKSHSKYYATRKCLINNHWRHRYMHRQIAHTPPDKVCHHKNNNSLDNRRLNLQNMSWFDHAKMHSWR